ncbi:MAG: calcium/sodium antiporter [Candidatus Marinimicrobia bacterium]|nr:calcium/sodium antiporter [Candidatus Neomarinimicrobiota bacterium]
MIPVLQFIFGAILLYYGAEYLIRSGKLIAVKLGAPPLLIGITFIAFGTSLPELIVSIYAVISGASGIALGNIIGSNIANIGLILGLTAVITPIHFVFKPSRIDFYFLLTTTLLFGLFLYFETLTRITGILFLILLSSYSVYLYRTHKNEDFIVTEPYTWKMGLFFIFGIVGLWQGSDLFIKGSVTLAEYLGVSPLVIGTTIVALGTSLPELATSMVAASKNEPEIAVGNIIGSNLFNILAVMGIVLQFNDIIFEFSSISISVIIMVIFTMLLVIILRRYNCISRKLGLLFLIVYTFSIVWVFQTGTVQ